MPAPRFFAQGSPSLGVREGENWLVVLMAVTLDVRDAGRSDRGSVDMASFSSGNCDDRMCRQRALRGDLQSAASSGEYADEEAPSR